MTVWAYDKSLCYPRFNKLKGEIKMAGVYGSEVVRGALTDPMMSVSRTPFNPQIAVIKKASFKGGEVPAPLAPYLLTKAEGEKVLKGVKGTTIYKGKLVPKTAAKVAELRAKAVAAKTV